MTAGTVPVCVWYLQYMKCPSLVDSLSVGMQTSWNAARLTDYVMKWGSSGPHVHAQVGSKSFLTYIVVQHPYFSRLGHLSGSASCITQVYMPEQALGWLPLGLGLGLGLGMVTEDRPTEFSCMYMQWMSSCTCSEVPYYYVTLFFCDYMALQA